jgi:hypothetical protein
MNDLDPIRLTFEVIACLVSFFGGKGHEKRRKR